MDIQGDVKMRDLRGNIFEMVSEKATDLICKTAIKVTESSCNKCGIFGFFESEFPIEIEIEKEIEKGNDLR